jgi:hypothetical protein
VKRVAAALLMLSALSACAARERPEGIVERWLSALNQGSAGEPLHYANQAVSEAVLPGWRSAGPGAFDVIEVGRARSCAYRGPAECDAAVPFRVVLVDGDEVRSDALVGSDVRHTFATRVFAVTAPGAAHELPSEGAAPIGSAGAAGWLLAVGIGLGLILLFEGAMRLVRRAATG